MHRIDFELEGLKVALDLPVAGFYLPVIEVIELNCLFESKEVFLPVVTLKGLGDSFGGILYSRLSHEGQASGGPVSPAMIARMMFMPVTPVTFESTLCR